MCLDVATGKPIWERRFSVYLSDVPQHRAAWASPALDPETGNIYAFTVGAAAPCARARREDAVEPFDGGRVRCGHHARRAHRLARHRWRQGGDQRAQRRLGRSGAHEQPVLRLRQADRRSDLGQRPADLALRHQLLHARRRRHRRRAHADRRRHRWRDPCSQRRNRRAAVGVARHEAGDQQQRAGRRHHCVRDAQRGEHHHERDGHGGGGRRHRPRQGGAEPREVGDAADSSAGSRRR